MSKLAKRNPVVVIDVGTGYTKLGYAGNKKPDYIIPTCIHKNTRKRPYFEGIFDLDFTIGEEAEEDSDGFESCGLGRPLKNGIIRNMNDMELFWEHAFFKYLRCSPDDHFVMLTDPPLNPPEKRMEIAEIMFETYNVSGLYFAVQAVLALVASWTSKVSEKLNLYGCTTGTVIDSGAGVTHIVPVVDGRVISNAIKSIPLAGWHITNFIRSFFEEREKCVPRYQSEMVAERIKEEHAYICKDIVKEFDRFDSKPDICIKQFHGSSFGREWKMDVGPERFLGPELFFYPEIGNNTSSPLHISVDETIRTCPIEYRRGLYRHIVLSGGSAMFKNFDKRLHRDLTDLLWGRKVDLKRMRDPRRNKPIEINVITPPKYNVWFGGSMLAANRDFLDVCKTREDYREIGPDCCRHSSVFTSLQDSSVCPPFWKDRDSED